MEQSSIYSVPSTNTSANITYYCNPVVISQYMYTYNVTVSCSANISQWYIYDMIVDKQKIDEVLDKLDAWRIHES